MSKITFMRDDITYGKYVSERETAPAAILVPQGKYSHLVFGITLVPASEGDGEMQMGMPEHYEAERIELLGTPDYAAIVSSVVRLRYSADEIEAIVLNGEDDSDLQRWREEAKIIARTALGMSDALECAKAAKIADIAKYDTSSAVNGFTYGGEEFWLPRETRVSVMNTANILKAAGVLYMDLWLGKVNVNLPVDAVIQMLAALEQYALACYNTTALHKSQVEALETVEEVMTFDVSAGYPAKLAF